jgi:hypothetical protein
MSEPKNTYKFAFKVGNKTIKTGVTTNLMRKNKRIKDGK